MGLVGGLKRIFHAKLQELSPVTPSCFLLPLEEQQTSLLSPFRLLGPCCIHPVTHIGDYMDRIKKRVAPPFRIFYSAFPSK